MGAKVTVRESFKVQGDDCFIVSQSHDDLITVDVNNGGAEILFTAEEAREVACCMIVLADRLDEPHGT